MSIQDDGVETKTTPNSPENSEVTKSVTSPEDETKDGKDLSRRQALAKEREELEKRTREYEDRLQRLESQLYAEKESKLINTFKTDLQVDSYDEEIFAKTKAELSALPLEKAIKFALIEASQKQTQEQKEESEKSAMRKNASLAPAGTAMQETNNEFSLLPKDEYSKLIATRGTEFFRKYNQYWEARGKGSAPYRD